MGCAGPDKTDPNPIMLVASERILHQSGRTRNKAEEINGAGQATTSPAHVKDCVDRKGSGRLARQVADLSESGCVVNSDVGQDLAIEVDVG